MDKKKYWKSFFVLFCLLSLILPVFSIQVDAALLEDSILKMTSTIDFEQNGLITEEYEIQFDMEQERINFSFPILENESESFVQSVSLAERGNDSPLFLSAVKMEGEMSPNSELFYEMQREEQDDHIDLNLYYHFKAGQSYTVRFILDRSAWLQKSNTYLFVEYPITQPLFANGTESYVFQAHISTEYLDLDYRIQSMAETWFQDITKENHQIIYVSEDFHFRNKQRIFLMLPAQVLEDFPVTDEELEPAEFFPNPESIIISEHPIRQILQNKNMSIFGGLMLAGLVLIFWFLIESNIWYRTEKNQLNRTIFDLDAAHAGFLYQKNQHSSLLLAGLLQLVQKGEIEINNTVFRWLYPEREDFSRFKSSEVFLLQWLFEDKQKSNDDKYAMISVQKINLQMENEIWAQEYSANFKKYLSLLEDDLFSQHYLNIEKRKICQIFYKIMIFLALLAMCLLGYFNRSLNNLLFLVPVLLSVFRLRTAKYLTLKGKEKWSQLHELKQTAKTLPILFEQQEYWIETRDFAPLLLPYMISFNRLEKFLQQCNRIKEAKVGVLELVNPYTDYAKVKNNEINRLWKVVKNDMLRMYYILEASFVKAEIMTQEKLMKNAEWKEKE